VPALKLAVKVKRVSSVTEKRRLFETFITKKVTKHALYLFLTMAGSSQSVGKVAHRLNFIK
jgi:hypothetical protein